jgi:hypothetical protein
MDGEADQVREAATPSAGSRVEPATSSVTVWLLRLVGFAIACAVLRYVGLIWGAILGGMVVLAVMAANRVVRPAARPMMPAVAVQAAIATWSILGATMLTLHIAPMPIAVIHLAVVAPGRTHHSLPFGANLALVLLHLAVTGGGLAWLARRPSARPVALLTGYHVLCMAVGPFDLAYMRGILEYAGVFEEAQAGLVLQFALRAFAVALMFTGLRAMQRVRSGPPNGQPVECSGRAGE